MGMSVRFDSTRFGFSAGSPIALDIGGESAVTAKSHVISGHLDFRRFARAERSGSALH